MGGRSSSKTKSVTNTDNRQLAVQDGIGAFSEGDTNITVSDFGAIDRSLSTVDNTVNRALSTVDTNNNQAFEFGRDLQSEISGTTRQAFDLVNQGFRQVKDLAASSVRGESGEAADTTKILILVAGGLGALFIGYQIFKG